MKDDKYKINLIDNLSSTLNSILTLKQSKSNAAIDEDIMTCFKILILDDATSAIDLETAKEIRKSLSNNRKCTTIFITSKIAEALEADRVMVIDDGKLVGFDTPSKLLKNNA